MESSLNYFMRYCGVAMHRADVPNQLRCLKCQAPLGQSEVRCPFCGTEVEGSVGSTDINRSTDVNGSAEVGRKPYERALVGMTKRNKGRTAGSLRSSRNSGSSIEAAVFAAAALLLLAVGGTAAFFLTRDNPEHETLEATPMLDPLPKQAPLNINGVVLNDGLEIDPTDITPLISSRVAELNPYAQVKLLAISVHGARMGKVNLDDTEASISFQYLAIRRDPRAAKANERSAQRIEFMLRSDAPPVTTEDESITTTIPPEPLCVWGAAWQAAVASGLSDKDRYDVVYAYDKNAKAAVWTFTAFGSTHAVRVIDGRNCAIKTSRRGRGK